MLVQLRDTHRRRIGRVEVDPSAQPTRVEVPRTGRTVIFNWDSAVDDAGHLRRCIACGCTSLFRAKNFPQVTLLVVFLAFAGAAISALGLATDPVVLGALVVVLGLDMGILIFSRQRLVCYRCRSTYARLPIARYHEPWDKAEAERFPQPEDPDGDAQPPPAGVAEATRT
jgi:hypothetical protein